MLNMIVAMDKNGGIGKDNDIPWKIQQDTALFRKMTSGHVVCMGRNTWDSLPVPYRPLPKRENVVLTTKGFASLGISHKIENVHIAEDIFDVLPLAVNLDREVWVIGGANVYQQLMGYIDFAVITVIDHDYECDAKILLPVDWEKTADIVTDTVLDTKSLIHVNVRYSVFKATKDGTQIMRNYGRGIAKRVSEALSVSSIN